MAAAPTVGWIGTGRMGYQLALRLLKAGYDVGVYNRTREKARDASPPTEPRSSTARPTSPTGTSSSSWSRPTPTSRR